MGDQMSDAQEFVDRMTPEAIYLAAIKCVAEATSGKYGNTTVPEALAMEMIARYGRIHAIPGNGKDEYYDSNRGSK